MFYRKIKKNMSRILAFPKYLEKVKIAKAYNYLLSEFIDFEIYPQRNIFFSTCIYTGRKKCLKIKERRFTNELVYKFGDGIYDYYNFANEDKDEDKKLERFFDLLFLKCLSECYKNEETDIFFCDTTEYYSQKYNGHKLVKDTIDEVTNTFSSIPEERRNVMLSKLEKGWIECSTFIPPHKAFGVSLKEIPLTIPEKHKGYFYYELIVSNNQEKFSFLDKVIESEKVFENFIDSIINTNLRFEPKKMDDFVKRDKKGFMTRVINMDFDFKKERGNFIKSLVWVYLLNEDNLEYNLGTLSPKGRENLLCILDDIKKYPSWCGNILENIDFYMQYINALPC